MLMDSVIGHRGVAAVAPENTLVGIRKGSRTGRKVDRTRCDLAG